MALGWLSRTEPSARAFLARFPARAQDNLPRGKLCHPPSAIRFGPQAGIRLRDGEVLGSAGMREGPPGVLPAIPPTPRPVKARNQPDPFAKPFGITTSISHLFLIRMADRK